jgi:small nuclear ribonucleoprotein (snRNP)-like protein
MNFCPPVVPQSGTGGGERFRNSALAEYQNRKIFFSLIEKIFVKGRLKKCLENFSVLLAEAKRRRTETLGGIQSKSASGFCSKKVRISSKRHRHFL